jgi:predicted aspartyl protease
MGVIFTTIKLRNPMSAEAPIDVEAKVDNGATLLVLPGDVARRFNLPVIRKQNVKYANETIEERDIVGVVGVEVCGRKGWFEAIVEPAKKYALLGAVVMESPDLIVEQRGLSIYPNPRSVLPMAEVE